MRTNLVRAAVDQPKGSLDGESTAYTLASNDQMTDAREFRTEDKGRLLAEIRTVTEKRFPSTGKA